MLRSSVPKVQKITLQEGIYQQRLDGKGLHGRCIIHSTSRTLDGLEGILRSVEDRVNRGHIQKIDTLS